MTTESKLAIIAAGLKADKSGFSAKQQEAALVYIMTSLGLDADKAKEAASQARESGILNASQTLQFCQKLGVIETKQDEAAKAKLLALIS